MAGGKGTRFWPLSRSVRAKQFLKMISEETLLEQTLGRILPAVDETWVVGNQQHDVYFSEIPTPLKPDHILYEPIGRNTAPCIGWAAAEVLKRDPDGIMVVLPADHAILHTVGFRTLIDKAVDLVKKEDCLVTLGITPTFPHTGFGYIESKSIADGVGQVVRFREKPNYDMARKFIESGRYFWNAGIFVWKASTILRLIKENIPQDAALYDQLKTIDQTDPQFAELFTQFHSISIDFSVMEHSTKMTRIIPADIGWDDIGNWSALQDHWPKDEAGNATRGELLALNSRNNIVYSEKKLVALIDVDDLVVVETEDAILVLPKRSDQKIRELYELLPAKFK